MIPVMNPAIFYTILTNQPLGKSPRDMTLHDAAWALFNRGISRLHLLPEEDNRLPLMSYGAHGKPCLKDYPDIHFSVSHAGCIAVCVFADEQIGIDVQDHRDIGPRRLLQIADRFFSEKERILLRDTPKEHRPALFYRLWAAKEAYAKYTGKGLREDFSSFTADLDGMAVIRKEKLMATLTEPFPMEDHSLLFCTENPVEDLTVERL